MKPGRKPPVVAEPLDFTGWPPPGHKRVDAFCREYLRVPKGTGARRPLRQRPWQRQIARGLFPARGTRPRQGVVTMPRGNGKTGIAAGWGLYALYADEVEGAQVLCVASDQRQAEILFRAARRMVELDERLAARTQIYNDRLYVPHTDSMMTALPADPGALQGWDPSLAIVDELGVVTRDDEVWNAMALSAGKRDRSLCLAISTPAETTDSQLWRLVDYGRAHPDDRGFHLVEYAAPHGCDLGDEAAWKTGNPALNDFLALDAMRATLKTTREPVFRRFRLGQWVGLVDTWLPFGAWDQLAAPDRIVMPGEKVVVAFDGSASGDSTALMGATLDGHVFTLAVWANPGDPRWRVPRSDVDTAVANAFDVYDVVELAADPWGWRSEIEQWATRFGDKRVLECNTAAAGRMGPATDRMYQAVMTGGVSHDGDERLSAHMSHCVARSSPAGDLVTKDKKMSTRKIDAAVAAIVAFDRASFHANKSKTKKAVSFR